MKIVIEVQALCTPTPRGIPIYTIQLVKSLLKRNVYDYSLTLFDKGQERNNRQYIERYFGNYNVNVFECNSESYATLINSDAIYNSMSYNELTGACGDVFHFPNLMPIPTKLNGKMIVTVHDVMPITLPEFFPESTNVRFKECWDKLLDIEPTIVTDSFSTKKDIYEISGYTNVHVVPLGFNEQDCFYDNQPDVVRGLNISSPYIFYCGGIDMRKNILRIVEAFDEVKKSFPNLSLVLAGAPYANAEPIMKMLEKRKTDSSIIYLGYISDEHKRILSSNAQAFMFPAIYEGFGLPILEAMACGCPVITSDVSSMPEVAGDAALLVNPKDTLAIADAMYKLVSDASFRLEISRKGFEQVKKFSWSKTAEMMERVYKIVY